MIENDFFKEVESFVFELFKSKLSSKVVYHNFMHTQHVVQAVNEIGMEESVSDDDLEALLLAAWFHDTGFTVGFENHEEKSKKIAGKFLQGKSFSKSKIEKVHALIDVTKMPQKPTNKNEQIICDADLQHLGTELFAEKSNLLRSEWEQLGDTLLSDIAWLEQNEIFLSEHSYFTNYAFAKFNDQKTSNWLKVKKDLRKAIAKKKRSRN